MIEFVSIFLGLVAGTHTVELLVEPPVKSVAVVLDGRQIAELTAPPWKIDCDFGDELLPHELVAIGRNAGGEEIARIRQGVNHPRPAAEARLVLEGEARSPERARVVWNSLEFEAPVDYEVLLNGAPVAVSDLDDFRLPAYEASQPQLLSVELRFPGSRSVRVARSFGGGWVADRAGARLTALPVRLLTKKQQLTTDGLAGAFRRSGAPLQVVAVEAGRPQVFFVMDPWSRYPPPPPGSRKPSSETGKNELSYHAVLPLAELHAGRQGTAELFPTQPLPVRDTELAWFLAMRRPEIDGMDPSTLALSDAVGAAGQMAAVGGQPRAVVLLTSAIHADRSHWNVADVRRYLAAIHVPLYVWTSVSKNVDEAWGPRKQITRWTHLSAAVSRLRADLRMQRIVWLAGDHPIHQIEIGEEAPVAVVH